MKAINKLLDAIRHRKIGYWITREVFRFFEKRRIDVQHFASSYIFDNRQIGCENLLLVILGFQPEYWEVVLNRVKHNVTLFSEKIDVCLCVPSGMSEDVLGKVRQLAEYYNFSSLYIYDDLLAQVQNTAIQLHPHAQWIYKIDEDIIISDNYFQKLKQAYCRVQEESYYPIGFISPLLNVNAGGFRIFLQTIGKWDEFKSQYPHQHYWSVLGEEDIIHRNTSAALYIWQQSVPFDKIAAIIEEKNKGRYSICPIRMSIGAILFTRKRWEEWGFFDVKGIGAMGAEEAQICAYTINIMQTIVIAEDTFAGHLGFYHQKDVCKNFFKKHMNDLKHTQV